MKSKKITIILFFTLLCVSCSLNNIDYWRGSLSNQPTDSNAKKICTNVSYLLTGTEEPNAIETSDTEKVIEETQFYKLTCENEEYYCYFYDLESNVVKTEGPLIKLPKITFANETCLKLTVQAGTGVSTQYGYYYDFNEMKFSEVFYWILTESNDKIVYAMADKVVIQDIFDKANYYKEISNFRCDFSPVIEPIIKAEFTENDGIIITYLTGNNFEEITELFLL